MSALRWEPWREAWVLHRDEDLIAVDKPSGLPTHAPEAGRADDVRSRLGRWLAERGEDGYLGVHQRLDRETSGVLVFTRRKSANASLAAQFEGRTVRKTYLAVVARAPKGLRGEGPTKLVAHLAPLEDGTARVVPRGTRGAKEAVTTVRIVGRTGDHVLLECRPETGRSHQIRAQLAAASAPIVGDLAYGGTPAPRLLLHAARLELDHPASGRPLRLEAPAPPAFRGAEEPIAERLARAFDKRYALGIDEATTAFRLVHGPGDDAPEGFAVDRYGDHLVVSLHAETPAEERERWLDAVASLGADGVYLKARPKHASVLGATRTETSAPGHAVRGVDAPASFVVRELGLPYEVRLGDGLSTGIFLDQRENRRRVRELSAGARVANLFCYTGPFTVAALAGGASRTVSVDVSRTALAWAERNAARVAADRSAHAFVEADVIGWLERTAAGRDRFDLVLLDPPSFATTKTSRFAADHDYPDVAAAALRVLAPGGALLACTNHRGIVQAKLRRWLHEAARAAGVVVEKMRDLPPPVDFPPVPGREPHLKSVLVRIAAGAAPSPRDRRRR